jgi:uncharacterized protein involved in exopolysaccharide biosynthesis
MTEINHRRTARRPAGSRTIAPRSGSAGRRPAQNGASPLGATPARPAYDGWAAAQPRRRRRLTGRQALLLLLPALVIVALGATGGWAATQYVPPKYSAHADVLYSISTEQPTGFLRQDRNITTQLVLVDSQTVLQPVAAEWNVSVETLGEAVAASAVEDSEIIRITLTDADPQRAERMLAAVVDRYLAVSSDDARAELREYIDGQLTEILGRISELRPQADSRWEELGALVEREQWLRRQLDELQFSNIAGPAVSVLAEPYVNPSPVSPEPLLMIAAGAFAGLVLALPAVALLARRMTRA